MSMVLIYALSATIFMMVFLVVGLAYIIKLRRRIYKISQENSSFKTLCDIIKTPIWFKDENLKITWVNKFYAKMFDRSRASIYGLTDKELSPSKLSDGYIRDDLYVKESRKPYVYRENEKSGMWFETTKFPLISDEGNLYGLGGIAFNITAIKKSENLMHSMVYNDYLTGIPNRLFLSVEITKLLSVAKENNTKLAVIGIDLDNFKDLNDLYGHSVGNEILKKTAQKLKLYTSDKGMVIGRLGGDEFVVVIPNVKDDEYINQTCNDVRKLINTFYDICESNITINISVGVSIYPDNCDNYEDLMRQTDMAVHTAKSRGRNCIVFYDEEIGKANFKRINIEINLKPAIENDEFSLYYQPKVSVDGKDILGFEALLRWNSKELGFVSPADFIPVAEQSDLIVSMSDWVMRKAMVQNLKWKKQFGTMYPVAVNLSAKQIHKPDFLSKAIKLIEELNYPPEYLELEITESMLMSKDSDSRKSFETLRGMGVKISMDDFGTGYSNLSYLSSFPLDKLKIDRRFVTDIDSSKGNQQIVNAIIMLAQAFNLSLIAEGVEGGKELKYLQSKGVDVIQGFYFSKPLPPEQVYDFVNDVKNGVWISKVHDSFEKLDDHYSDKIGKKESTSVTVNK